LTTNVNLAGGDALIASGKRRESRLACLNPVTSAIVDAVRSNEARTRPWSGQDQAPEDITA